MSTMFAPPVRRRPVSSKPLTPASSENAALNRSSSANENSRSTSRKRAVDKVALTRIEGDTRVRRSASSVPRGRSSSPSECIRGFPDRGSRDKGSVAGRTRAVSSGMRGVGNGFRDLTAKGSEIGIRTLRHGKENANLAQKKGALKMVDLGTGGSAKKFSGSRVLRSGTSAGQVILSSQLPESCGVDVNGGLGRSNDVGRLEMEVNTQCCAVVEDDCKKGSSTFNNSLSTLKVSVRLDGEGEANESSVGSHANNYPSRLHEKLAFLEGKVKRIASDIKRTKEMLDMNNPDASKMILSDIQDKISGIEKVVGNDTRDSNGKAKSLKGTVNYDQATQLKQPEALANSVNGLNGEELEARFFPHHKLLRTRTSSGMSHIHEPPLVTESSCGPKVSLGPIDDDPIALAFLASLGKEQSEVLMRKGHADLVYYDVQEVEGAAATSSTVQDCSNVASERDASKLFHTADETLGEFDDQENKPGMITSEEIEHASIYQLNNIGCKTSTGGWFVSEGEAILLAHDDSSCSYYDIANCEVKTEYKPPSGISSNLWRDCWIIRAPSSDGCSGRYVVAASAGNTMDSGFCSWDFYTKDVKAFHIEDGTGSMSSRTVLGPLPGNTKYRRNAQSNIVVQETQQWWYKPSGPLIISTASGQRVVRIYDIRDGEHIMKWDLQKPVSSMNYSSPLQWRNRGKVVVAEAETISVWDVNSLTPEPLLAVPLAGQGISALHINNTDAELGGGVRQRVSSSEAEGHDGVFCTHDTINVLDFRNPTGVGLKIPKHNVTMQSVFSRGDSIFLGCSNVKMAGKQQLCSQSQVQQFSMRQQKLFSTYYLPESNAHSSHTAITQVWGNSNLVMGVCGLGLFMFDALKEDNLQSLTANSCSGLEVREVIGPDDLHSPSFDYSGSRALLISGDRPAMWQYLS